MLTPKAQESQAYIETIECKITFEGNLDLAKHEYAYSLRHYGDDSEEDDFFFVVPNATPNEIGNVTAYDGGDTHQPSVSRDPWKSGSILRFSNLLPVAPGQPKLLRFSYHAPTSSFKHRGILNTVGFYRAELVHTYEVRQAKVIISLPKGSRITNHVGSAKIEGETIIFDERNLRKGEVHSFPIFFYRRKTFPALLAVGGSAALGAALDEAVSKVLDAVVKLF